MTIHSTKYVLFGNNKQGLDTLQAFLVKNYFRDIDDLSDVFFNLYEKEKDNNEALQKFCKANYVVFLTADTDYTPSAISQYTKYAYAYALLTNQRVTSENQTEYKEQFETRFEGDLFNYAKWVKLKDGIPTGRINTGYLHTLLKSCINYIVVTEQSNNNGIFYLYQGGVYNKTGDLKIKSIIKSFIPDGIVSDSTLNGVVNLLKADGDKFVDFSELNRDEFIINFKNGLYDVKADKLKPHTPEIYSTRQLQANYNPSASANRFIKYLDVLCSASDNLTDKEKKQLILEFAGVTISNLNVGRRFKKCLCLMSRIGDTGKSVFLNVLTQLLGVSNTTNLSIQNLCDRFSGGDLYGKRAIISGDQSSEAITDSSKFKQITGGDVIRAEFKGIQSFNYVYDGVLIFACNDLPTFKDDKGKHVFDRFLIIKCERYLQPNERDRTLTYKLLEELDGIAYLFVQALRQVIANGYNFSQCASSDREVMEYRKGNDPMAEFLSVCCDVTYNTKKDRINKTLFESTYKKWRNRNGYNEVTDKYIKDRANKNGIEYGLYYGKYHYKGVKFKLYSVEDVKDLSELPEEFIKNIMKNNQN